MVIQAGSDLAIVMDEQAVIIGLAFGNSELYSKNLQALVGKNWEETVSLESRIKVQTLLKDAKESGASRLRQINVAIPGAADLPFLCAAIYLPNSKRVVALYRDLREVSLLQQRLIDAQQTIELDYARLRDMETRNRILFEIASSENIIIDSTHFKILEANARFVEIVGEPIKKIIGKSFLDYLAKKDLDTVREALSKARYGSEKIECTATFNSTNMFLIAAPFRSANQALILISMKVFQDTEITGVNSSQALALFALENSADAFVVTNLQGNILSTNHAFRKMIMVEKPEQLLHESLEIWLERASIDLKVMLSNLQAEGSIKLFATTIRDSFGTFHPVEISASAMTNPKPCIGFSIREIGSRIRPQYQVGQGISRSNEELTQLVGRLPLKEILNETTDLIEELCIKAALDLSRGNRVAASEMLGLSRQSLYIKLRKFGLNDPSKENDLEQ
jgi:transcriptional regulator PpsR